MAFTMTGIAQGNNIGRIKNPVLVALDVFDMVDIQQVRFLDCVGNHVAICAGKVIALHDRAAELCVEFIPYIAFQSKLARVKNVIEVWREKIGILFRVEIPVIRATFSLIAYRGYSGFVQSLVPRDIAELSFSAIRMMAALVFRNSQSAASILVNGERGKSLATAFADCNRSGSLSFGDRHSSSLPQAGKIENSVNCGNRLTVTPRQIRSQAPQECGEGSTTRAWSPERTVKPHERAARKGRDSLVLRETVRSGCINSPAITIRPYSGKLEDLAKFSVRKPVMQALRNDAKKTFDRAAYAQFYLTPLRVGPTGGTASNSVYTTTNGTATGTTSIAYSNLHAKAIVDVMKERNIPWAANDCRYSRGLAA